jgi:hypothetical protein
MGAEGNRDSQGREIWGGVEVDRNKGGNGRKTNHYDNTRMARRRGEGEPGEMREGGGERERNEGMREVSLMEQDDGDRKEWVTQQRR